MSDSNTPANVGSMEWLGHGAEAGILPLPTPWDFCYVWNGPYGARKFTAAHHNGRQGRDSEHAWSLCRQMEQRAGRTGAQAASGARCAVPATRPDH